jgi:capsular polysaccharide biosynthesis protein
MKILALILVIYTIFLNNNQTNLLKAANELTGSEQVKSQLNMNIICSYVFSLFLGLLILFIIKSFF